MNWTDEQKRAITERGGSLLVSAAAGSGKTAVLANRVIDYIVSGGSLDRLLVVTFTRLAASEMRERIGKLLQETELPDKTAARRQRLLLHKAKICTIDSFFGEIVRNNFKALGIAPDFRMLDETEYAYVKSEVLRELLEERYADFHGDFAELLRLFGGEGENESLSEQINKLYVFLQALPFPEDWADGQKAAYNSPEAWTNAACEELLPELNQLEDVYDEVIDAAPFKDLEMSVIQVERAMLTQLTTFLDLRLWDNAVGAIKTFCFERSPSCKKDVRIMQKYKLFRNRFKELLAQPIFSMNRSMILNDLLTVRSGVFALIDITLEYIERVNAEMKRKNAYSFDAVAHFALSLTVTKDENGVPQKTPFAEELSAEFDELLIDEYQDVNDLQDCFFSALSHNNNFAVGDVKQSIYMFRQANPDNFLAKEGLFPVIYLNKNFRSRKGILDFCNFFFRRVFSPEAGGMSYGDNEALYSGANYPETGSADVELHLLSGDGDEEKVELQARFAARRIKELISEGLTVGNETPHPARFSDFAVIIGVMKNVDTVYERIFFEESVPCFTGGSGSFLGSPETATVFAFMKAIDNPYDDLSLFAAMFSPIGGFSADETAKIKLIKKKAPLFDALTLTAETDEKAAEFIAMLDKFRVLSRNLPVDALVRHIYEKTGYPSYVSCLPLGYLRHERLMSFYAFARDFGSKKGGSLYDFLRFTENAAETGSVKTESSVPAGDFVRIMTIHASKGLEFPVVIIPQLNKQFNLEELKEPLITDISAGIATVMRDPEMLYQQTTFMREVVAKRKKRKLMSEYLRLLYVAFTRAKERLILISSGGNYTEEKNAERALFTVNGTVCPSAVLSARSPEILLLEALTCHPECKPLITNFSPVSSEKCEKISVYVDEELPDADDVFVAVKNDAELPISAEELERRCRKSAVAVRIPAKLSVTELAKNRFSDDTSEQLISYNHELHPPKFLTESGELSGAEAGSAVHAFVSLANLDKPFDDELMRLFNGKFLIEAQVKAVMKNRRRISTFAESELYKRISSCENVRKEEYFVSRLPAKDFNPEAKGEILLQGAIDLICDTGDGLLLLDYKTDRADADELVLRYEKQLEYYAYAAEKCFGKPVTEAYIWSFYLSHEIKININGGKRQ